MLSLGTELYCFSWGFPVSSNLTKVVLQRFSRKVSKAQYWIRRMSRIREKVCLLDLKPCCSSKLDFVFPLFNYIFFSSDVKPIKISAELKASSRWRCRGFAWVRSVASLPKCAFFPRKGVAEETGDFSQDSIWFPEAPGDSPQPGWHGRGRSALAPHLACQKKSVFSFTYRGVPDPVLKHSDPVPVRAGGGEPAENNPACVYSRDLKLKETGSLLLDLFISFPWPGRNPPARPAHFKPCLRDSD